MKFAPQYRGFFFLLMSSIVGSASSSVIAAIIIIGNTHLIEGRNPISFCNVLFVGNFVAFIALSFLYKNELKSTNRNQIANTNLFWVFLGALLSGFITPTFMFLGIMYTNVINVILISTMQIPLTLFWGWLLRKEPPSKWLFIGALLTMVGAILIVILEGWFTRLELKALSVTMPNNQSLNLFLHQLPYAGEICVLIGTISSSLATFVAYHATRVISVGIYSIFQMALGTIFFFFIASFLFGKSHFIDLFSPFLWEWMLLYGCIIVGLKTFLKFRGLQLATAGDLAITSAIRPVSAVIFAYLILGTIPNLAQVIGGIFIVSGIAVALFDKLNLFRKNIAKETTRYSVI